MPIPSMRLSTTSAIPTLYLSSQSGIRTRLPSLSTRYPTSREIRSLDGWCRRKLPRNYLWTGRWRPASHLVICAAPYDEAALSKLKLKELKDIMAKQGIKGVSGTKAQLKSRILRYFDPEGGDDDDVSTAEFMNVQFEDREALISRLCRFTLTELRSEMRRRGAASTGRKMDVVSRLAMMMEEEAMRSEIPDEMQSIEASPLTGFQLSDLQTMNDVDIRVLLEERTVGYGLFYTKYLDVSHFAYSLFLSDAVMHQEEPPLSKEALEQLMVTNMETLRPENENIISLKSRCDALGIPLSEKDSRRAILNRLNDHRPEDILQITSDDFRDAVLTVMKQWLREIQDQSMHTLQLNAFRKLDDCVIWERLKATAMRTSSCDEARDLLEKAKKLETGFHLRSLAVLAAQMLHRLMQLRIEEIGRVLRLDAKLMQLLHDAPIYKDIANLVFLRASLPAFDSLYAETINRMKEMERELKASRPQRRDDDWQKLPDPPLCFGLVFGGSRSRPCETFSSVRCLLDHLHTMPYTSDPIDPNREEGTHVQLYYLANIEDTMSIYKLTSSEFFSLGPSAFERSPTGIFDLGDPIDVDTFLSEIEKLHAVISLTPSLDILAERSTDHNRRLAALDGIFLGSSAAGRRLSRDRYACLTFLKKKGYVTPPLYSIRKKDFDDLEKWNVQFRNWCGYHRLAPEQALYLRPSNAHDRFQRLECSGAGDMIVKARSVFFNGDMTEALIQPMIPSENYVDFSCVVIETAEGPKALMPTEYEKLPEECVRPLSVPYRCHSPPRFSLEKVTSMRRVAERAYEELQLSGFACVHGRMLYNPESDKQMREEALQTPRPIPEFESPYDDPVPDEVVSYMADLQKETEEDMDAMVKNYDETEYTLETLRFFEALDRRDAEQGVKINRYRFLRDSIERIRHRHDKKENAYEHLWEMLIKEELLDEAAEDREVPSIKEISSGADYSIAITGIDASMDFSVLGLIFQQAAVSGLSHASILRHLINLKLSHHQQLPPLPPISQSWHPLFPENYNEIQYDPAKEIRSKQIWILCGGDGTGHQASLASGINALMKFHRTEDVQPYLFILDAGQRIAASPEVLKRLHHRRDELMKAGVPEDQLLKELSKPYLASPATVEIDVPWRPVWCLQDAHILHTTIDEAIEASERLRLLDTTSVLSHTRLTLDLEEILLSCQKELDAAGVEGVAGLWGGSQELLPPRPRMMTMDVFAAEAEAVGATIFLAVQGDIAQDGTLQNFLAERNIPYTGCGVTASQLCGDKEETATYLDRLEFVSALSQRYLPKESLIACSDNFPLAEDIYNDTKEIMDNSESFCLKPNNQSFGAGVVKISKPEDLEMYGTALVDDWSSIRGNLLTGRHRLVPMPKPQSDRYIMEPYIPPVDVVYGRSSHWVLTDRQKYIEVSFGLVGDLGRMWVLTPSFVLSHLESRQESEERLLYGIVSNMTPIPDTIARPSGIENAKRTVEKLADAMGLKGVARVDAFMHVQTGDLCILEVDTTPYLGEHSIILQQAALEKPPMFPDEVFQQILRVANTTEPNGNDIPQSDSEEHPISPDLRSWDDDLLWNDDDADDLIEHLAGDRTGEPQASLSDLWKTDDPIDTDSETQSIRNAS